MWGDGSKQRYYRAGKSLKEIGRSQIEGVCACGYITLKPNNDMENHNGGLTVKRSSVDIFDNNGNIVKVLRPKKKDIQVWGSCNACVNQWK